MATHLYPVRICRIDIFPSVAEKRAFIEFKRCAGRECIVGANLYFVWASVQSCRTVFARTPFSHRIGRCILRMPLIQQGPERSNNHLPGKSMSSEPQGIAKIAWEDPTSHARHEYVLTEGATASIGR